MSGRISSAAFIGRAEELSVLAEAAGRSEDGPAVVVVGGEAGVGKTRLVSEFAAGLPGVRVLQGGCLELGQSVMPFAPLVAVLRQLSRSLGPERTQELYGDELSRFLPEPGRTAPPDTLLGQSGLFESVLALLARLAEESRLVLIIEDLHWADHSTLDLLSYLARNLAPTPILVIGTYRSDELRRTHPLRPVLAELSRLPHVSRIQLQPMNELEVERLMAAIRGERPLQPVAERILARSEGNPFFVEELLAADALSDGELPSSLRDILAVRLDTLPASAKDVVRIAAAAGRRVDHRLLEHFAQLEPSDLIDGLRAAVDGGVLVADADGYGYRFRHALLQEAVHEQLLPGERTRLHADFAEALAKDPDLAAGGRHAVDAELAYHALAAHDVPLAFFSLVRAGRRARDLFAFTEAQQHFVGAAELRDRVAVEPSEDAPPVWELLRNAALCNRYAGDSRAGAIIHLRRAIQRVGDGDSVALGGLYAELSESLWMAGLGDEALEASDRSIEVLGDVVARERAEAMGWRSRLFMLLGRYDQSIPPGRVAVDLARSIDAKRELSRAANALGTSLSIVGDAAEGGRLLRESIAVGEEIGAATEAVRGYVNLASSLRNPLHHLAESEQVAREGLAYGERQSLKGPIMDWLRLELVDALVRQGRLLDASEEIAQVRSGALEGVSGNYYESSLATIRALQGRYDECATHLRRAEELAPDIRDPQAIAPVLCAKLQLMLARGLHDLGAMLSTVESMLADPNMFGVLALMSRVEAEAALAGDRQAVGRIAHLAELLIGQRDRADPASALVPNAQAWLEFVEAELARASGEGSPSRWQQALAAMTRRGHAEQELYSQLRLAEALAQDDRAGEAEPVLQAAYMRASSIGAVPLAEGIESLARRTRLKLPGQARRPTADEAGGLTSREREVLALVSLGRTNREIGKELFISDKTASVHVSNILAKLGASNRGEAAAKAHQLGIDGA